MERVVHREFEMGVRFPGDLDEIIFVSAIEITVDNTN